MPVAVEAQVKPSRQRWVYSLFPVCAGLVLFALLDVPWFAYVLWICVIWLLLHRHREALPVTAIRFEGDQVELWQADQYSCWQWRGVGRLSHAFVEWTLLSESLERYQFRLWRDAVSEPSWRAINMAYRVNCSHARQNSAS